MGINYGLDHAMGLVAHNCRHLRNHARVVVGASLVLLLAPGLSSANCQNSNQMLQRQCLAVEAQQRAARSATESPAGGSAACSTRSRAARAANAEEWSATSATTVSGGSAAALKSRAISPGRDRSAAHSTAKHNRPVQPRRTSNRHGIPADPGNAERLQSAAGSQHAKGAATDSDSKYPLTRWAVRSHVT